MQRQKKLRVSKLSGVVTWLGGGTLFQPPLQRPDLVAGEPTKLSGYLFTISRPCAERPCLPLHQSRRRPTDLPVRKRASMHNTRQRHQSDANPPHGHPRIRAPASRTARRYHQSDGNPPHGHPRSIRSSPRSALCAAGPAPAPMFAWTTIHTPATTTRHRLPNPQSVGEGGPSTTTTRVEKQGQQQTGLLNLTHRNGRPSTLHLRRQTGAAEYQHRKTNDPRPCTIAGSRVDRGEHTYPVSQRRHTETNGEPERRRLRSPAAPWPGTAAGAFGRRRTPAKVSRAYRPCP